MYKSIFTFLLCMTLLAGCINNSSDDQNILDCGDNYECLHKAASNGESARIVVTEKIESLSIIEKSEVMVEPLDGEFRVSLKILELTEMEKTQPRSKSVIGSLVRSCPQIRDNLRILESKGAVCTVPTAEAAKQFAMKGLTDASISKYGCTGDLIDVIREICVTPDFPHFPPGVKKPAVYLYPENGQEIAVSLSINGIITKSEPDYLLGWNVWADPDGTIDGEYDYLFYEARLESMKLPDDGWMVEYKGLEKWFDMNLPLLGLNQKESEQFKEYWLEELEGSDLYEIKLLEKPFLDENMALVIVPEPDSVIRVNFYFKPHSEAIHLNEPMIETPVREGFTVVEWGGILDI